MPTSSRGCLGLAVNSLLKGECQLQLGLCFIHLIQFETADKPAFKPSLSHCNCKTAAVKVPLKYFSALLNNWRANEE